MSNEEESEGNCGADGSTRDDKLGLVLGNEAQGGGRMLREQLMELAARAEQEIVWQGEAARLVGRSHTQRKETSQEQRLRSYLDEMDPIQLTREVGLLTREHEVMRVLVDGGFHYPPPHGAKSVNPMATHAQIHADPTPMSEDIATQLASMYHRGGGGRAAISRVAAKKLERKVKQIPTITRVKGSRMSTGLLYAVRAKGGKKGAVPADVREFIEDDVFAPSESIPIKPHRLSRSPTSRGTRPSYSTDQKIKQEHGKNVEKLSFELQGITVPVHSHQDRHPSSPVSNSSPSAKPRQNLGTASAPRPASVQSTHAGRLPRTHQWAASRSQVYVDLDEELVGGTQPTVLSPHNSSIALKHDLQDLSSWSTSASRTPGADFPSAPLASYLRGSDGSPVAIDWEPQENRLSRPSSASSSTKQLQRAELTCPSNAFTAMSTTTVSATTSTTTVTTTAIATATAAAPTTKTRGEVTPPKNTTTTTTTALTPAFASSCHGGGRGGRRRLPVEVQGLRQEWI
jgi:hypothetical protein